MEKGRIRVDLPLPSISLKNFIEKLLKDDEFFSLALENPVAAMEQNGLNVREGTFAPSDFASFFGAIAGLKEMLAESDVKEITFESIFGKPADIRGKVINAEREQGFFKQWDNRDAYIEREFCYSGTQKFEAFRDRMGSELSNFAVEVDQNVSFRIDIGGVSTRYEHSETWNHTETNWSGSERFQQSNKGTSAGVSKNFESDGRGFLSDLMRGPLIHPADLVEIAARIQTFVRIMR